LTVARGGWFGPTGLSALATVIEKVAEALKPLVSVRVTPIPEKVPGEAGAVPLTVLAQVIEAAAKG